MMILYMMQSIKEIKRALIDNISSKSKILLNKFI